MWEYGARVLRVVDGDTVDLDVDLGMRVHYVARVRLNGIDAPERYTEEGRAALAYLQTLLPVDCAVIINTAKAEKYGRWLASIGTVATGIEDVSQAMLDAGHAKVYS